MIKWLKRLFGRKEVKPMIDDQTVIQRLMLNEGCRNKAYYDTKHKLTIGIGRNLDDNPLTAEELCYIGHNARGKAISNEQAAYLCRNDIATVKADLDRELPWWRDLCVDRQFVMIDLCFNMGIGKNGKKDGLLGFKNTLPLIAQGYYEQAAKNLLQSKYAKDVGERAKRNAYCLKYGTYLTKLPKEW
jgi:lysozyme